MTAPALGDVQEAAARVAIAAEQFLVVHDGPDFHPSADALAILNLRDTVQAYMAQLERVRTEGFAP